MRRSSMEDYANAIRDRYLKASRMKKGRMLDEFTEVTGYHRKAAIRLLVGYRRTNGGRRRGRPREYAAEIVHALKQAWEATDHLCGKRLQPFLPELIAKLQDCGELSVEPHTSEKVCTLSASTVDRLLRPFKDRGRRHPFSTTKPGNLLKAAIPIRTFADWNEDQPGFLEMDLVAHCAEGCGLISTKHVHHRCCSPCPLKALDGMLLRHFSQPLEAFPSTHSIHIPKPASTRSRQINVGLFGCDFGGLSRYEFRAVFFTPFVWPKFYSKV